jgi:hypothetical protein
MLEKLLLVIFGGIVGSYITSRLEILKAWKSYMIVRAEIDRNLSLLENIQRGATPEYSSASNDQQKQIDQMIDSCNDKLPVRVSLLLKENMPIWSYRSWDSQLHLLAQIISESQVRGLFDMQVDLEQLSSIHARLSMLVSTHGDTARNQAVELFKEWEFIATRRQQNGNPFFDVPVFTKFNSVLGLHRIGECKNIWLNSKPKKCNKN